MLGKDKKKPVRLAKKVSIKENIQNWYIRNRFYLFLIACFIAMIIFLYLILAFAPGTESGVYYNNRTGGF